MKIKHSTHWLFALLTLLIAAPLVLADAASQFEQANSLMEGKRYKQAHEVYRQVIPQLQGDKKYEAMYGLGYSAQRAKMRDQALEAYRQLIDSKEAPQALVLKSMMQSGYLYALRDENEKAREIYAKIDTTQYAEDNPSFRAEVRLRNSYTYGRDEKFNEVKFDAAMSVLDVKDANFVTQQAALCLAGNIRQEQGRYDEAIKIYQRAVDMGAESGYGEVAVNRLVECEHAAHADAEFFIDPYVSLTGPDKASIFWISKNDISAGNVQLFTTTLSGKPANEVTAKLSDMADQPFLRQKADFTNLKPHTLYHYRITCGEKIRTGAFRTHNDAAGPVRFVVLGDTQTGWQNHEKLGPMIAAENPEFVLHLGDCVEKGNRWDEWKVQLFDPGLPYLKKAPLWVSRGNHDGGPYFVRLMGMEDQSFTSFASGDVRVIVLNSQDHMGRSDTKQLSFLTDMLAKKDTQWVITTQHHPMFHTALGDTLIGQTNFRPVIEADTPDLVFNGHYHCYTRLLPIGQPGQKPLINIISGGGGGRMGNITRTAIAEIEKNGPHHYCLVEIDGNRLKMTVKGIDGSILDQFELIKKDGKFQPEVMKKMITPEQATKTHMALQRFEKQQYKKSELSGRYDAANGRIILDRNILKPQSLPPNTTLLIESQADSPWQIEKTQLLLSEPGELAFSAIPPKSNAPKTTIPNPQINVTLQVDGQDFIPKPYTILINFDSKESVTRTPY